MSVAVRPRLPADYYIEETPQRFRIRNSIYTDAAIFEREMEAIFETTWVYIGHESEVPRSGDYKTTAIGRRSVLLTRVNDRSLVALLNTCRHRAAAVCREERGNSLTFQCPYHGWVYANTGELLGISQRDGYPASFAAEIPALGLRRVPRLATYRGLIFASLSPHGITLEEHLSPVRHYIDLWNDMSPVGTLQLRTPHRVSYPGNWKFQMDNSVDGYHARYVHQSAMSAYERFGVTTPMRPGNYRREPGCTRGFERGHNILERPGLRADFSPEQLGEYESALSGAYGAERAAQILVTRHISISPNLVLMDANLRVVQPVSVDCTLVYSWFTALDGVAPAINAVRLRDLQGRMATTGLISPDDFEIFAATQSGASTAPDEWSILDRGLDREIRHPAGEREGRASDETPQRAMYRGWADLIWAPRPEPASGSGESSYQTPAPCDRWIPARWSD
jgi:phenylpropionate dioxygenase-like ring-hydroxylating dioxygenase large terminal subunit